MDFVLNGVCDDSNKLKSLCKSSLLQRIHALDLFLELLEGIVKAFNEVTSNFSKHLRDFLVDPMSLTQAMLRFEFILTLGAVE